MALFGEYVARAGKRGVHRDLPIIVLLGKRGSGKSTALDDIAGWCERRVPYARLDLDGDEDRPPSHIVVELASRLAMECPQFGRMPFPRVMLCWVVATAPIDSKNRVQAWRDVRAAVAADVRRPRLRETVDQYASDLVHGGVLPAGSREAASVLLSGTEGLLWRRRLRLAKDGTVKRTV